MPSISKRSSEILSLNSNQHDKRKTMETKGALVIAGDSMVIVKCQVQGSINPSLTVKPVGL